MDFRNTTEEAAFREKLRAWLSEHIPEGWGQPGYREPQGAARLEWYRDWSRKLYEGGFSLTQPQAGGGVAFFAHVGGFLFGFLTGKLIATRHQQVQTR